MSQADFHQGRHSYIIRYACCVKFGVQMMHRDLCRTFSTWYRQCLTCRRRGYTVQRSLKSSIWRPAAGGAEHDTVCSGYCIWVRISYHLECRGTGFCVRNTVCRIRYTTILQFETCGTGFFDRKCHNLRISRNCYSEIFSNISFLIQL